jgi:hypothetical protein
MEKYILSMMMDFEAVEAKKSACRKAILRRTRFNVDVAE